MTEQFHNTDNNKIDSIIRERRLNSLINNKKWVKLISILVDNSNVIKECRVKLIWETNDKFRYLLFDENTSYNFDYYEKSMEAMISGEPKGWYAYKEIEWLDFPSKTSIYKDSTLTQDIKLIKTIIEKIGPFEIKLEDNNLRLYAYKA